MDPEGGMCYGESCELGKSDDLQICISETNTFYVNLKNSNTCLMGLQLEAKEIVRK